MFRHSYKEYLRKRMELHMQMHASLVPTTTTTTVPYGTAGFRGPAKQIGWIFYRAGILAAVRCYAARKAIGVMITASHNHVDDNGVKFIDENGLMMSPAWEQIIEELCNIRDIDEFFEALSNMITEKQIYTDVAPTNAQIFIGYDTRPTSEYLAKMLTEGINDMADDLIPIVDFKLCTTPELHWLVGEENQRNKPGISKRHYWEKLVAGAKLGLELEGLQSCNHYKSKSLVVDCANGVGMEVLKQLQKFLEPVLTIKLINVGEGILNELCGADYVKTNHKPVIGANDTGMRYASLDGDADRLVYFYFSKDGSLRLLDGDRIQALFATFISRIMALSRYGKMTLSLGCIQTAYANGASTDFLKSLQYQVDCTDTGVKNLHKQAVKYDVGIYFEANGHGTIHLSQRAKNLFTGYVEDLDHPHDPHWQPTEKEEKESLIFKALCAVLNFYTGDGISDILLVEIILKYFDWDMDQWYDLYTDRPSRLIKLAVKDKSLIKTIDAGRKCCSPPGLQAEIDAIVAGFGPHARCFVRASGTENVVRVYAEGDTQVTADEIANLVGRITREFCDNEDQ